MKSGPLNADEPERLRALRSYGILDGSPDEALDALVRVASSVCEAPISLLSLVDEERQWFLASTGLPGVKETPRELSFCAHAILSPDVMVVEDASTDPRFADNPLVVGDPYIRFYAGCPLVDKEGFSLGTLCVVDRKARSISPYQSGVLRELSTAIVRLLEARRVDNAVFAAEQAARSARADLAMVLNTTSSSVSYWDTSTHNRFANDALLRRFNLTSHTVRGLHFREVFGEAHFLVDLPFIEGALRGEPQRFESSVLEPSGRHRHMSVTFTPDIRDGKVHGFISTANDVSDLKAALLTSQQRTELLTLAEEVADIGHWRVEIGSDLIYWSPQVYRIHARDPATFRPTLADAVAAYHPDDRTSVGEAVESAIRGQAPFAFERRIVRPDGSIRRVEAKGRCEVHPTTGATRAVFGVIQDVTERHGLRERVGRQERLVTTGTLAAGVGHEINNPLTYVTANVEFAIEEVQALAGTLPPSKLHELLDLLGQAREGGERIRKIVRGLRAFAREGAADAPHVPTDVHAALEVSASMAVHDLRSRATLTLELGEIPPVLADEARLSQLILNLLVNAAQAFLTDDPAVNRVVARTSLLPDGRVSIEIEDNGPGIASDVLPRIFDPFFTTKEVGGGTGLGLAIAHNLVVALGGELTCSTVLGRGTTFRVLLPAAAVPLPEASPTASAVLRPRARVLVVDDEPGVLRAIERALRAEHDVTSFEDPREALRLLLQHDVTFDVVFCDLMMPHVSGMALYARVKEHDAALVERFVFLTGGVADVAARSFLAEVPNERLEKPFSTQNLRGVARRFAPTPS